MEELKQVVETLEVSDKSKKKLFKFSESFRKI